jgi:hypothetical protein
LASPIFFLAAALMVRFSNSPAFTMRLAFKGNDSGVGSRNVRWAIRNN